MGYAVVGYFDQVSDARIRALWKGMADIGVCDYLINSENSPHIKLAMYDSLDLNFSEQTLQLLARRTERLKVHFKSYSFYPNEKPFMDIDITVSMPVLELQDDIRNSMENCGKKMDIPYFDTGIWKPDCQLTVGFDKLKLPKAIDYLSETKLPFDGMLESVGIIEFHPAKKLFTLPFS